MSSDTVRLWVDPKLNYAVRQRDVYFEGRKAFEVRAAEHRQVAPGVWIPMRIVTTDFGSRFDPAEFLDKPLYSVEFAITDFRHNIPLTDAMFRIEPQPGEWVVDNTRVPVDEQGQPVETPKGRVPGVSYIQPADQTRLDEVIARASRARPGAGQGKSPLTVLLAVNVGVVLFLGMLLVARWWRRRDPSW